MGCCNKPIVILEDMNKNRIQKQLTAHHASTYLVSCMDFSPLDDIVRAMDKMGYNNNYDQFIIEGASLGFSHNEDPHWRQSVMDHLEIGMGLHQFRQFIFIDHLDCEAYKKFMTNSNSDKDEKTLHKEELQKAQDFLAEKFPDFKFHAYIIDDNGELEKVEIKEYTKKVLKPKPNDGDKNMAENNKKEETNTIKKSKTKKLSTKVSLLSNRSLK
jgi:hypothetical protein